MGLSTTEVAKYLGVSVKDVHRYIKMSKINAIKTPNGYDISLEELEKIKSKIDFVDNIDNINDFNHHIDKCHAINVNATVQKVIFKDARNMEEIKDNSVNLVITSPPYFNAKKYSDINDDLGNIDDFNKYLKEIRKVWEEVYRALQPGRKFFLNIMNLPIKEKGGFRTLNLVGKMIDLCEDVGFIFKRDIIWHKTNSVKAHFGTYPYPGGLLINNSHEFILEFEKPCPKGYRKYAHITTEQKEASKLDKDFWISIKKSDVWTIKPENSGDGRLHVAPFPYDIPYRLVKGYSYVGETILDPFLGSGTTLVVARDLKRNGIGYEINPKIGSVAIERIKQFQKKLI